MNSTGKQLPRLQSCRIHLPSTPPSEGAALSTVDLATVDLATDDLATDDLANDSSSHRNSECDLGGSRVSPHNSPVWRVRDG